MNKAVKTILRPAPVTLSALVAFALFCPTVTQGAAADRVSVIHVPGASKVIKAQRGTDGTIHLLFDGEDGPRYACSHDNGVTFGESIGIVDLAAQKPGLKFSGEDLAVGPDGRVHVAMANNAWKLKLPQEEWSFYYASLAPGKKSFSPLRNLNRKSSEGFSLAAGEHGLVTASFLSGKLFVMESRDGGESFAPIVELDDSSNPCDCCTTSTAYGPDGRVAVLYREETNDERDMHLILWDQARGAKASRTRISGVGWKIAACPMTYFTINRTDQGYVAAWPTKGEVYFARLSKDGAVLPPGEIRTPGSAGMRNGVLGLGASDGATLVAWKNKDTLGWQLYDSHGRSEGEPGTAESQGHGAAGVVLRDGRFLVFP